MDKHRLKLLVEKGSFNVGCFGINYTKEELGSLPQSRNLDAIGALLTRIREKYGERVDISIIDPRNMLSIFDNIRYNVKSTEPTWILDNRKIFVGIPSWHDLEDKIDNIIEN